MCGINILKFIEFVLFFFLLFYVDNVYYWCFFNFDKMIFFVFLKFEVFIDLFDKCLIFFLVFVNNNKSIGCIFINFVNVSEKVY